MHDPTDSEDQEGQQRQAALVAAILEDSSADTVEELVQPEPEVSE